MRRDLQGHRSLIFFTMDEGRLKPDKLPEETVQRLVEEAFKAKSFAWSPYSKFKVGCALLSSDGKIFTAIVVATDVENSFVSPCGGCRQIISEFGLDYWVILTKPDGSHTEMRVKELLPHTFTVADLRAGQKP